MMKIKAIYKKFGNNGNPIVAKELIKHVVGSTKIGKKSQFKLGKHITSFSISPSVDKISCRQFYTTSNGLLTYLVDQNKFLYFKRKDLNLSSTMTNYTTDGTYAVNATVKDSSKYNKVITNRFNKILKEFI